MRTELECIPCILRQTVDTARLSTDDPEKRAAAIRAVMEILKDINFDLAPPVIGKKVYGTIAEITGDPDPYKEIKTEYNQKALTLYPMLKALIEQDEKPVMIAAKLAAAGNVIDFGVKNTSVDLVSLTENIESLSFVTDHSAQFLVDMRKAKKVLYLADNAGEIVFDRIFIEILQKIYQKQNLKIIVAVRGMPVINDVTLLDAEEVGLTEIVKVIANGDSVPGTDLQNTSAEFKREFMKADLIISKGMGNFETLDAVQKPIYHLLKAKCKFTANALGVELGSLVFVKREPAKRSENTD